MNALAIAPDPAPDAPPSIDVADVRRRLLANRRAIASSFFERGDVLAALDTALMCREHVLLVGSPGTGKSDLSRTWATQFTGTYREDLFTRQSVESDHLAYLDVQAFTQGDYKYRLDGKLTEADIAFADETFKASGGFLNALLGWLNERNTRAGKSPLITCIGASNEFGEDESVAALEDRLLFRFWVEPMADRGNRLAFLTGIATGQRKAPTLDPISIPEVEAAQAAAAALTVDPLVLAALLDVQDSLRGAHVSVTDRRIGKCIAILKAAAWLDGCASVELDHLDILRHVLWVRPADKPAVEAALGAVNKGVIGEIRVVVERLLALYHDVKGQPDFRDRAVGIAAQIQQGGRDLRAQYKGKIPERIKDRAAAYLEELRKAHEDCLAAAQGGLRV